MRIIYRFSVCIITAFCFPVFCLAAVSNANIKATVQVFIYDNQQSAYISSGSGVVMLSGGTILTNYHVAEKVIISPDRYSAIICVQQTTQSSSDCSYMADAYYKFGLTKQDKAEYSKELDLAVLNLGWKLKNNEWISISSLSTNEWLYNFEEIKTGIFGYDLSNVNIGDDIQTLGYPDYGGNVITYSNGVITRFIIDGGVIIKGYDSVVAIITNAKISYGSSGGAALDKDGKFLGLTSAGFFDRNGNFLEGVIIPVNVINLWWRSLGHDIGEEEGSYSGPISDAGKKALCMLGISKYCDSVATPINGHLLVKTDISPDVYAIYNNTKRKIRSLNIFNSYNNWLNQQIKIVSQSYLDSITETTLIKVPNSPDVYVLAKGFKRLLASIEIFNSYGFDWNRIVVMNETEKNSYSDVRLIKYGMNLYWIDAYRKIHLFPSMESLKRNGYSDSDAIEVNDSEFTSYVCGDSINN